MDGTRTQDDLEPAVEQLQQAEQTPNPPTAPDGPGPGDEAASGADDQDAEAPNVGDTLPPEGRVDDL